MTERSATPRSPVPAGAQTPNLLQVSEAKARLLAWAAEHEAARQAARSKLGPLLVTGVAAAVAGLAITGLLRSRKPATSHLGAKARGLGSRLLAFAAVGQVARNVIPHVAGALFQRLVHRFSAQASDRRSQS